VVVGGGPTGVELAGALAEITRHTLRREFKRIDPRNARIVLVEGMPRLLTAWPESLSESARRDLIRLGVEVRTGAFVTHVDERGVDVGNLHIAARTVLWGAGVKASPLGAEAGAPVDKSGRVKVTPALSIPGHDEVFVIGDLAAVESEGRPVPGLAGAAMQQGRHAARNVLRRIRGQRMRPFHYRDRGSFAVVGRGTAVGVLGRRVRVNGVLAWLAWLGIHIVFLMGFRNRVAVLLGWAYTFFTRRRPMWLITGRPAGGATDTATAPHLPTTASQPPNVDARQRH
jgi:NADH dehydrogenase